MWSDSEAGAHHQSDTVIVSSLVSRRESVPSLHSRIPEDRGKAPGSEERRLLWIDDEKSPSDPDVWFLTREGFQIDCVVTGSAGLAMARTGRYQGILLDLRLPDLPGLAVLATLRAEGIDVPVLVLTGFGDFESARLAGTFGAAFKAKPLYVDDLEVAVHKLIARSRTSVERLDHVPDAALAQQRAEFTSIAHLLEQLQRVSEARHEDTRLAICMILVRTLADPAVPMPAFLACAKGLKRVVTPLELNAALALLSEVETTVIEALARSTGLNAKVARAIVMLRLTAERHQRIKLEEIAASFSERIDAERLGTLIKEQTGFYFTDWRTGFLVRPSVAPLLNTTEDVKQILRRLSAFKDLSHFDHEFHRFFGLSPSDFRGLWRFNRS